jgi:hypothetical protein
LLNSTDNQHPNGENVPNENQASPVQDALNAQLRYEINGEELNKVHKHALQQKYGLAPVTEDDITAYMYFVREAL